MAWMDVFFTSYGEHMPYNNEIHLPCWFNRGKVHRMMSAELSLREDNVLCYERFCSLWKNHFQHVKIPRVCDMKYIALE